MSETNANIRIGVDTSDALVQLKNLQRQISQFHTQMASTGKAAADQAGRMQASLMRNVNATGQFTAQMTTVRTSTESFTNALEKNKLSLGQTFRFAGASSKRFGRLFRNEFNTINKVAAERVKDLQTQYIKLGRNASGAMEAIKIRPRTLDMQNFGTQTAIAAQRQQMFNQLIQQGSTNLLNWGKNTQWAGRQLMVGFTVPLTIFGGIAIREFQKIEEQAIKFRRVYGDMFTSTRETDKALSDIRKLADEFTKYGIAVEKTVDLAAKVAQMGNVGDALETQVREATRLSILGGMEQQEALDTTIGLTNAFGLEIEDLTEKVNFLNAAENQTILAIQDFNTAVPLAGSVVKELGGSVEDLAFFLTAMREGGINASQGANALKSSLARLISPTKTAQERLGEMGINVLGIVEANAGDLRGTIMELGFALEALDPLARARAIETLFGRFQFARMSTLFSNIVDEGSQANKVLELTTNSAEELAILADRELGRVEESAATRFQKVIQEIQAALAPVGEAFLEVVVPILNHIKDFVERFGNMGEAGKKVFVALVTGLGVVAPALLMVVGLIANGIANLMKFGNVIRNYFTGTAGSSKILTDQYEYMNSEQIRAASIAASLNQSHTDLIQTFNVERESLDLLAKAYDRTISRQEAMMMGRPIGAPGAGPTSATAKFAKGTASVPGYANGIVSIPGPKGKGDIVPAMLSPGEAVIPTKQSQKYGALIKGIIADNIPGFFGGRFALPRGRDFGHMDSGKTTTAQSLTQFPEGSKPRSIGDMFVNAGFGGRNINAKSSWGRGQDPTLNRLSATGQADFSEQRADFAAGGAADYFPSLFEMGFDPDDATIAQDAQEYHDEFMRLFDEAGEAGAKFVSDTNAALAEKKAQAKQAAEEAGGVFDEATFDKENVSLEAIDKKTAASRAETPTARAREKALATPTSFRATTLTSEEEQAILATGSQEDIATMQRYHKRSDGVRRRGADMPVAKRDRQVAGEVFNEEMDDAADSVSSKGAEVGSRLVEQTQQDLNDGMAEAAETNSESERTRQIAADTVDGYVNELERGIEKVQEVGAKTADAAARDPRDVDRREQFQDSKQDVIDKQNLKTYGTTDFTPEMRQQRKAEEAMAKAKARTIQMEQKNLQQQQAISNGQQAEVKKQGLIARLQEKMLQRKQQRLAREGKLAAQEGQQAAMGGMGRRGIGGGTVFMAGSVAMGASMMGGPVGEAAGKLAGPLMGLGALMPMLSKLPPQAQAAAIALGVVAFTAKAVIDGFNKAAREALELEKTLGRGRAAMDRLSEAGGNVTASQIMDRRRDQGLDAFQVQPGKSTFGENFFAGDAGEEMLEGFKTGVERLGRDSTVNKIFMQLGEAVAQGALDVPQALSIATQLGAELGDLSIGIDVRAKLLNLLDINGTDLTVDPLEIQVQMSLLGQEEINKLIEDTGEAFEDKMGAGADAIANSFHERGVFALFSGEMWKGLWQMIRASLVEMSEFIQRWPILNFLGGAPINLLGSYFAEVDNLERLGGIVGATNNQLQSLASEMDLIEVEYGKKIEEAVAAGASQEDLTDIFEAQFKAREDVLARREEALRTTLAERVGNEGSFDRVLRESLANVFEGDELKRATEAFNRLKDIGDDQIVAEARLMLTSDEMPVNTLLSILDDWDNRPDYAQKRLDIAMSFGGGFAEEMDQILTLIESEELQEAFVNTFDPSKNNIHQSTEALEALTMAMRVASNIGLDSVGTDAVMSPFLGDDAAAKENRDRLLDTQARIEDLGNEILALDQITESDKQLFFNVFGAEEGAEALEIAKLMWDEVPDGDRKDAFLVISTLLDMDTTQMEEATGLDRSQFLAQSASRYMGALSAGREGQLDDELESASGSGQKLTSVLDDIVKKLRDVRLNTILMTNGWVDSANKLEELFGSGKGLDMFNGIEQSMRRLGMGEDLISLIVGMDPDEFERKKDQLFTFDAAGNIAGITNILSNMGRALRAVALGDFQSEQERTVRNINDQIIAMRRLTAAGLSQAAAYQAVQDAAFASAVAQEKNTRVIRQLARVTKEAAEMTKAFAAAQAVVSKNEEAANRRRAVEFVQRNIANLTDAQKELVLTDPNIQALLAVNVDPAALRQALADAEGAADLELQIRKLTFEGKIGIFEEGFNKAMEKFRVLETEIKLRFDVQREPLLEAIQQAEREIAEIRTRTGGLEDLEADLQRISWQEQEINKEYDKRVEALDAIENIQSQINQRAKDQLDVADALSRGDIAGAARAAQEARNNAAEAAAQDRRDKLEQARQSQLATLVGKSGLNREQIEERVLSIQKEIFNIEQQRIVPAQRVVELLNIQEEDLINSLTVLGKTKTEWEEIRNRIDLANVSSEQFKKAIQEALDIVDSIVNHWNDFDPDPKNLVINEKRIVSTEMADISAEVDPSETEGGGGGGGSSTTDPAGTRLGTGILGSATGAARRDAQDRMPGPSPNAVPSASMREKEGFIPTRAQFLDVTNPMSVNWDPSVQTMGDLVLKNRAAAGIPASGGQGVVAEGATQGPSFFDRASGAWAGAKLGMKTLGPLGAIGGLTTGFALPGMFNAGSQADTPTDGQPATSPEVAAATGIAGTSTDIEGRLVIDVAHFEEALAGAAEGLQQKIDEMGENVSDAALAREIFDHFAEFGVTIPETLRSISSVFDPDLVTKVAGSKELMAGHFIDLSNDVPGLLQNIPDFFTHLPETTQQVLLEDIKENFGHLTDFALEDLADITEFFNSLPEGSQIAFEEFMGPQIKEFAEMSEADLSEFILGFFEHLPEETQGFIMDGVGGVFNEMSENSAETLESQLTKALAESGEAGKKVAEEIAKRYLSSATESGKAYSDEMDRGHALSAQSGAAAADSNTRSVQDSAADSSAAVETIQTPYENLASYVAGEFKQTMETTFSSIQTSGVNTGNAIAEAFSKIGASLEAGVRAAINRAIISARGLTINAPRQIFGVDVPRRFRNNFKPFENLALLNKGGIVPGIGNTDTVPALLTPGEFVITKRAVQEYGIDLLKDLNNRSIEIQRPDAPSFQQTASRSTKIEPGKTVNSSSVYNNSYSISVSVKSESNPDQIARTVIDQIKTIDSQRIRGSRI